MQRIWLPDEAAALSEGANLKKQLAKQKHVVRTLKAQSRPQKRKKKRYSGSG
jgi:hypothetical protein